MVNIAGFFRQADHSCGLIVGTAFLPGEASPFQTQPAGFATPVLGVSSGYPTRALFLMPIR